MLSRIVAAALLAVSVAIATPASAQNLFQLLLNNQESGAQAPRTSKNYKSNQSPIRKQTVRFDTKEKAGTIIIDHSERRLYYVLGNGKAIKYAVGVGREGFGWRGTHRVSRKAEWPGWTPPKTMIAREAKKGRKLPAYMAGGPNNPLGARAMYIGSTLYRIHGTNQPWTIGGAVSSGCIRMANDDVIDLYNRVDIGAKVIVRG